MNIQAIDQPKDVAVQATEAERAVTASKQPEEKSQTTTAATDKNSAAQKQTEAQSPEKVVAQAQSYFNDKGVSLRFKVLDDTNDIQVEVVNDNNSKVIRKIPQDEIVKLSENLRKQAKGVLDKSV
jgi:flagellar protein FlaG